MKVYGLLEIKTGIFNASVPEFWANVLGKRASVISSPLMMDKQATRRPDLLLNPYVCCINLGSHVYSW